MAVKPNRMFRPNRGETFMIVITLAAALIAFGVIVLAWVVR